MTPNDLLTARLEATRRELLDLSLRNPLLNYRPAKAQGLTIVREEAAAVFDVLVRQGKTMYFRAAPEPRGKVGGDPADAPLFPAPMPEIPADSAETTAPEATDRAASLADTKLQTDKPAARLDNRLLNTLYTARTSLEETGVNILYLALGMLSWYEADASPEPRQAPLVLVPVVLERSAAGERFRLRYTGADVEGNLSLQAKLKADFGLALPLPEVDEEGRLESYYDAVATAIRSQPRWRVTIDAIALGFFSFAKLVMYADLDPAKWPADASLIDHPAVRALLGSEGGLADAPPTVGETAFLDTESTANDLHQVLDADSSQLRALLAVVEGRNVVIQGPPGTGKSQTITNLIAEAIGAGKRVLFVAEKMAALEVVKRRLDHLGLGAACLELHSHKANKKALLEELRATLDLGRPATPPVLLDQVAQLPHYRAELNAYARAVNAPIGRSRLTPQQVAGRLLALREEVGAEPLPRIEFAHLSDWTDDDATHAFAAADRLAATLQNVGNPKEQLFWGSELTVLLPAEEAALAERLTAAQAAVGALSTAAETLAALLHLPAAADRGGAEALLPVARQAHREALVAHAPPHPAAIQTLREAAGALARVLVLPPPPDLPAAENLLAAARHLQEAPPLAGIAVTDTAWQAQQPALHELRQAGEQYRALHVQYDALLLPDAWDQTLHAERGALLTYGAKWWRFLIGDYRRARTRLQGLWRGPLPGDNTLLTAAIDAIHEATRHRRTLRDAGPLGARLFGSRWQHERTDFDVIGRIIDFLTLTHERIRQRELPAELLQGLADVQPEELAHHRKVLEKALTVYRATLLAVGEVLPMQHPRVPQLDQHWTAQAFDTQLQVLTAWAAATPTADVVAAHAGALEAALTTQRTAVQALADALRLNEVRRFGPEGRLQFQPFQVQTDLLAAWRNELPQLQRTATWNNVTAAARDAGFPELVALAERWPAAPQWLGAATRQTWLEYLQRLAHEQHPALRQFERAGHETVIERFRQADRDGLVHNRVRALRAHFDNLPTQQAAGGQMLTLRNEFARKRGHLPIRKLMQHAGRAVQAIKPVFMMSPLSVANFLAPGTVTFDLVVFDEASQVKPVDAFGAIARGKQLVVVGDSKQLPPTSFFDSLTKTDDNADEEDAPTNVTADIQSILELVEAKLDPALSLMLRWHYRSRHESLIAPSNHLFYDDKLVIFPSPAGQGQVGLRYHHLPATHYERGTTRTNPQEAATVADAVLHHARTTPHLTLGVVAFSTAQRQAIQDALEKWRRQHPETEDFFNRHPHEPFFVKNLENVQGDERDVIFISLGYGRTAEGYLGMNFGPLNGEGGERRLNVLITRARQRCEVFTNLTADDIDLTRTSARGVAALKTFLTYAQHGFLNQNTETGRPMESPFEEAVFRALTARGYKLRPQVGSQGLYIDLAVVDPDQPGRYVLGVECDGAMYHSARSARDRDRLRQQVLEAVGWRLHRIWSTDWFRDPGRETERLVRAIEAARLQQVTPAREAAAPTASGPVPIPVIEREEMPPPTDVTTAAQPYVLAQVSPAIAQGEFHQHTIGRMATWVTEVVRVESPVHVDEVARRLAQAAGLKQVGSRIRATVEGGVKQAIRLGAIRQAGDFLWLTTMTTAPLRDRSQAPDATRKLALVALEEIGEAVQTVVRESIAITREAVVAPTLRLLGFSRVTEEARAQVMEVVAGLLEVGKLREVGGGLEVGAPDERR